jgi:Thermostable hemolysin
METDMFIVRSFHPGQSAYEDLQLSVSQHFYQHHGACPAPRPDQFWCLTRRDGQAPGYACVGLTWGDSGKLFSEYYLDCSLHEDYEIQRPELVEIGQLSSFGFRGAGRFLLGYVLRSLALHHYKCALLTATDQVRECLLTLDVDYDDLGEALASRVRDKHIDWGTYYQNRPRVVLVSLRSGLSRMAPLQWDPPANGHSSSGATPPAIVVADAH